MSPHAYLIHRATKIAKPSDLELLLIDRDLAAAGVHIPWSSSVTIDLGAVRITRRVMNDVLEAA